MQKRMTRFLVAFVVAMAAFAPATAPAQTMAELNRMINTRQKHKNDWRNIAIASGAVGVLGLLANDSRLVFAGAAGALYSAYRYEEDRKSQSKLARARASYFSRTHFYRNGVRYNRRTVVKNGQRYYQFVRART